MAFKVVCGTCGANFRECENCGADNPVVKKADLAKSVAETISNAGYGLLEKCTPKNFHVNVTYESGFEEVIFFENRGMAMEFADMVTRIISTLKRVRLMSKEQFDTIENEDL